MRAAPGAAAGAAAASLARDDKMIGERIFEDWKMVVCSFETLRYLR